MAFLPNFFFNVEHGFLNFAFPFQFSFFLPQPLLLHFNVVKQIELHRGFRLLLCRIFAHQPIGGDGKPLYSSAASDVYKRQVMVSLRIDSFELTFAS